jgi:proteasome lid subunit RPN8/RPN11
MALIINTEHLDAINTLGEETFPDECCGFLLGKTLEAGKVVHETYWVENEREESERYNRFLITPDVYMKTEKLAREKGLDIIGFFHSHPDAPARPSQYDVDHAWPWYSYAILSVLKGKAMEMTSWVMADDRSQFNQEDVIQNNEITDNKPNV